MRPIALSGLTLSLTLLLCGCGNTWWNPPLTGGYNPNRPAGDSDNMRRVLGQDSPTAALESEPGDVWPGPLPPSPTLRDMELQSGVGSAAQQPDYTQSGVRGSAALPAPNPDRGSASPAATTAAAPNGVPAATTAAAPNGVPAATTAAAPNVAPVATTAAAPNGVPAPRDAAGQVIPTNRGPAVPTGSGAGYQTTTNPGGGSSIVVPNGNGTSTVIHPDGRVETIPTPK